MLQWMSARIFELGFIDRGLYSVAWELYFIVSSSVATDGGAPDSVNTDVYSGGRNYKI